MYIGLILGLLHKDITWIYIIYPEVEKKSKRNASSVLFFFFSQSLTFPFPQALLSTCCTYLIRYEANIRHPVHVFVAEDGYPVPNLAHTFNCSNICYFNTRTVSGTNLLPRPPFPRKKTPPSKPTNKKPTKHPEKSNNNNNARARTHTPQTNKKQQTTANNNKNTHYIYLYNSNWTTMCSNSLSKLSLCLRNRSRRFCGPAVVRSHNRKHGDHKPSDMPTPKVGPRSHCWKARALTTEQAGRPTSVFVRNRNGFKKFLLK